MNDDRSLERAARSWLEEGPKQAPDRAVDAALARIQTTQQERDLVPWRLPNMNRTARLVASVAALAVVVAVGIFVLRPPSNVGGLPTPGPTTSPRPRATPTVSFTSAQHGYRLSYPAGWIATPTQGRFRAIHLLKAGRRKIKSRAFIQLGFSPDATAMLAHDAFDRSKANAGPFEFLLPMQPLKDTE
jgi:hypothetical protein